MGSKTSAAKWNPLASKGRYFVYSLLAFGVPLSASLVMWLGAESGYGDLVMLVMLSLGASQMFAALTWPYMRGVNDRLQRAAENTPERS
jgi:hypothetical protein